MKKWIITLIFVLGCLPVVAIKAASPQTYIHLDYEIIDGVYYDMGDGVFDGAKSYWACSIRYKYLKMSTNYTLAVGIHILYYFLAIKHT